VKFLYLKQKSLFFATNRVEESRFLGIEGFGWGDGRKFYVFLHIAVLGQYSKAFHDTSSLTFGSSKPNR
jgi:hypothetical protein